MCSTVKRAPLMTALPAITSGFRSMRSSSARSRILFSPRGAWEWGGSAVAPDDETPVPLRR